jgi:hypothetical protein
MAMLDYYVQPYLQFASTPDRVCLSSAVAGEMLALPPQMRERVDYFFRTEQLWLTKILERGVARGEFTLAAPASKVARFVFGALQGALLVKRTTDDASQLNDVITVMKLQLAARPLSLSRRAPVHFFVAGFTFTIWTLTRRVLLGISSLDSGAAEFLRRAGVVRSGANYVGRSRGNASNPAVVHLAGVQRPDCVRLDGAAICRIGRRR